MADFKIKKFEDKPRYCRVPIFFGGERQIHIMQPYDKKKEDVGPEPVDLESWVKISNASGQVVFSLEVLEEFIEALRSFANKFKEAES